MAYVAAGIALQEAVIATSRYPPSLEFLSKSDYAMTWCRIRLAGAVVGAFMFFTVRYHASRQQLASTGDAGSSGPKDSAT